MDATKLDDIDLRVEAMGEDLSEAERRILDLQEENHELRRENADFRQRLAMIEAILGIRAPVPAVQGDAMDVGDDHERQDDDPEGVDNDDEDQDEEGSAALDKGAQQDEDEAKEEEDDPLPIMCARPDCNKRYKTQAALDRHVARTHDSDPATRKAHVCAVCSASFDKAVGLRTHEQEHKANGSHVESRLPVPGGCFCPACGRDLVTRRRLSNHISRTHPGWREENKWWKNKGDD